MKTSNRILRDSLLRNNVLSENELNKYCNEADNAGVSLSEYLLANSIVTEKQILIALSQSANLEIINLNKVKPDSDLIGKVPIKFVWYYKFLPVRLRNNILTIAVSFPMDVRTQDEIRMHLGFEVDLMLAEESQLMEAIKKIYGFASDTIEKIMHKEQPKSISVSAADSGQWVEDLEKQSEDPTVSNLVNQIILEAYKKRATDIHIEPYRNRVRFRYRIDGVLVDANLPEQVKHFIPQILSRIKILANLTITEKRLPQDGSAVVRTKEDHIDLRVSTMPTPRGESMVIRILPTKVMLFSLEKLGFDEQGLSVFRKLIKKPHGIILITGPTGSGKTTTLYACLNEINSSERKIITIEDPIEYEMDGITQVQVNQKINFDFSTGLRSLLRHDPDIMMVGEVRDAETAEIAIRTALTGHLVFSTLHTNDASSGVTRLIDMGIEPYLVASSVEAFIAQRLVRLICPKCKEEDPDVMPGIREEIACSLDIPDIQQIKVYRGKGCEHCNNTGYYGRCAIYEILIIDDSIKAAILEKPRADHIKIIAMRQGMRTLRQNGWKAVYDGITTPSEVLNVAVKDEVERGDVVGSNQLLVDSKEMIKKLKEFRFENTNERGDWVSQYNFEGRVYNRLFDPVHIRYTLLQDDPQNPGSYVSGGIDYPTMTEDISAGGLRFLSRELLHLGSILEMKIHLSDGHRTIECLTKVCRVEKDSMKEIYTIMVYYLDISSSDRATIDRYVEKNRKSVKVKDKVKSL
ncbi:MAG: Flp pilus assembly complex ATPase component TadA [Candidatus Omnitrophica bacterium]|nr:Flp pilus assembly complex ATPase component TadA [Candidatus Omnitrophota bacterium]